MGFRTDGSSHASGVKAEKNNVKLMQVDARKASAMCGVPLTEGEYTVEQRGGTQYTEDIAVQHKGGETTLSHKHKKELKTGSFDWLNSTKRVPSAATLKRLTRHLRESNHTVEEARAIFTGACQTALEYLSSDDIIQIIKEGIIAKYKKVDRITVEAQDEKTIYSFSPRAIPFFKAISEPGTSVEMTGRGATSRSLRFFDEEGNPFPDFGLRIRVTSNNGITAMLGINPKGKNNTSSPVIKLQQDKVHKMIAGIEPGDLTKTRI